MKNKNIKSDDIKKSLLPPIVNSIISAIFPGVGQVFAREVSRGIVLLMSFITIGGLLIWRIALVGRRYDDLLVKIQKAFYLEPILRIIAILFACYYIWIIIDAFIVSSTRNKQERYKNSAAILIFTITLFFILGWQIGKIDIIFRLSCQSRITAMLSSLAVCFRSLVVFPISSTEF